jgi:hypothetical protein
VKQFANSEFARLSHERFSPADLPILKSIRKLLDRAIREDFLFLTLAANIVFPHSTTFPLPTSIQNPLSYMFYLCSNVNMPDSPSPTPPALLLADEGLLAFTPVPLDRRRANGWTAAQQERFILALHVMGSVGQAAKAVGMSRQSAYNLREREGAESFAKSWDAAIDMGRARQFDLAMERAIHGVTTVRVLRGGSVTVNGGPDMRILQSALRSEDSRTGRTPLP